MIPIAIVTLLGIVAAAQQPQIQEQELVKPGQAQVQQPATPAQPQTEQKLAPAPPPAQQPQAQQPAPSPAAPPAQATPQPAVSGQHVPASEEAERGHQGKPVAAFWIVNPGK